MMAIVNRAVFCICFYFLLSVFCISSYSQPKAKFKKTIRVDFELPRPLSNRAFAFTDSLFHGSFFRGVYNVNLSLNWGLKNFNVGVYAGMMQCQIFPKYLSSPHSIQTVYSSGMRFSYDIYPSKEKRASTEGNFLVYSPFLSSGYSSVVYSRLQCKTGAPSGKQSQTFNISGGINLNLMFSEYDAIGFTIGYVFLNHEFNPDALCLTQYYPNIREKDKKGLTQYLIYGFNWYIDLAKRDKNGSE